MSKKFLSILLSLCFCLTACARQEETIAADMDAMQKHAEILTQQLMLTAFSVNEIKEGNFPAPDEKELSNFVIASVLYSDVEDYLYGEQYPMDEEGHYHFSKQAVQKQLEDVFALENWPGEISDSYSDKNEEWTLLSGFGIGNNVACSNISSEIRENQIIVRCDVGSGSNSPNPESWGSYAVFLELNDGALRYVKAEKTAEAPRKIEGLIPLDVESDATFRYPLLEFESILLSYIDDSILIWDADSGVQLNKIKESQSEELLSLEACSDREGYDYRLCFGDRVIYRSSTDAEKRLEVDFDGESYADRSGNYDSNDIYGNKVLYIDAQGRICSKDLGSEEAYLHAASEQFLVLKVDGAFYLFRHQEKQMEELSAVNDQKISMDLNAGSWDSEDYQRLSFACPEDMEVQTAGWLQYQERFDVELQLYQDESGGLFQSKKHLQQGIGDIRSVEIPGKTAVLQVSNDTYKDNKGVLQVDVYWLKLDGYCLMMKIQVPQENPRTVEAVAEKMLESVTLLGPSPFPTEEEYAALRQSVLYTEPSGWSQYEYSFQEQFPVDETGWEIARVLQYVSIPLPQTFTDGEYDAEYKLYRARENTESMNTYGENMYPQLDVFETTVRDTQFYLKEHVEETARILFGPDTVLEHQSSLSFRWYPKEGVYTPPHRGVGGYTDVALLDYVDHGDHYEATAVYLDYLFHIVAYADENGQAIPDEELAETIADRLTKYRITLGKGEQSPYVISAVRLDEE